MHPRSIAKPYHTGLTLLFLLVLATVQAQIEQQVHKQGGVVAKDTITQIDSIRFSADKAQMIIERKDGSTKTHAIADIVEVRFAGKPISGCRDTSTAIVEVINPITGKTWMDRNLGATTVNLDTTAFGDLYQWGRCADGHQKRNSATTLTLSSTDQPGHGQFIVAPISPNDWRNPQNDKLWQGLSGVNNPCPSGYRIPTEAEWIEESLSWTAKNSLAAFASPLSWRQAGTRTGTDGMVSAVGNIGCYWTTAVDGSFARYIYMNFFSTSTTYGERTFGFSVRCIKD